ncbi:MAG: amidase [Nitriliruptoraceae bacterium]
MEFVGHTAIALADTVIAGDATAREVVTAHLDRLLEVEHRLGAFVSIRRQAALADADAVDAHPDRASLPLAGVPIALTDVVDIAGEATRHGSLATSPEVADADDPVVARLRAAGAIVLGKTRSPELSLWGTSDDPAGTAISPWDPTRSAGGASGGAAAAVGAGVVPLALGGDSFGSLRIPAAACGVVGIRPGAPYLPIELAGAPHWFGMGRYGPLGTNVADVARMLAVMSGAAEFALETLLHPVDVAVSWRAPAPGVVVSGAWREAALEAGRLLHHAGHTVGRDDPPYERATVQATVARWTQGASADVAALALDPDRLQARTRAHVAAGDRLAKVSPVDDEGAERWKQRIAPFFEAHDLLLTPTFARVQPAATAWHTRPWAANIAANLSAYPFTGPWNLADLPAVVVPLWEDGGRPLSVQIVGAEGQESLVLSVAAALESMVPRERHAPGWTTAEVQD